MSARSHKEKRGMEHGESWSKHDGIASWHRKILRSICPIRVDENCQSVRVRYQLQSIADTIHLYKVEKNEEDVPAEKAEMNR